MNPMEKSGIAVTDTCVRSGESTDTAQPRFDAKGPYIPEKRSRGSLHSENRRILFIGAGIVLVFLLMAFSCISHQWFPKQKNQAKNSSRLTVSHPETDNVISMSITPILDAGQPQGLETDTSRVKPEQLGRLASKNTQRPSALSLAEIPPFESGESWHPAPYREGAEPVGGNGSDTFSGTAADHKDHEAMDKASLVFVANHAPAAAAPLQSQSTAPNINFGIGLPPGSRLRARLETAVSTAIHAPVIGEIEYNYERNGEILVPAGSKALGRIESADRNGYIELRFDSVIMPDGSCVPITATATDLRLQPLHGKVEGRHTGKNILLRSVAGVGEIAATLVGRGSLNQPLSETDLLRERVTNNIGQASDQSVAELAVNERIVVSLPSDTEIYVILQKEAKPPEGLSRPEQIAPHANMDELRQLLQLQREMSQQSDSRISD